MDHRLNPRTVAGVVADAAAADGTVGNDVHRRARRRDGMGCVATACARLPEREATANSGQRTLLGLILWLQTISI